MIVIFASPQSRLAENRALIRTVAAALTPQTWTPLSVLLRVAALAGVALTCTLNKA